MSENKSVFRPSYDEAIDKFEQIHEAKGGAFEEYVQFSKFIYGIFLKNKDIVITRTSQKKVLLRKLLSVNTNPSVKTVRLPLH